MLFCQFLPATNHRPPPNPLHPVLTPRFPHSSSSTTMSASSADEKGSTAAPSRWRTVAVAVMVALLLIWAIDVSTVLSKAQSPAVLLPDFFGPISASTQHVLISPNRTSVPRPSWISAATQPNFTATLLSRWLTPADQPCRRSRTAAIAIPAIDSVAVRLSTNAIHQFTIQALDADGIPRCLGGDYFETDLTSSSWKSRPPVTDHGNGSYSFHLQVHQNFSGDYTLTITLLFRSFDGLKFSPKRFSFNRELRRIPIIFTPSNAPSPLPSLRLCRSSDYSRDAWSGRWTRHAGRDSCTVDHDGRFRCLAADHPCESPWCDGPLGALESNGWVYSAHCSFKVFTQDSAWQCLNNRWLFFWGDSNHVDTIRNLLNFVLGLPDIKSVPRRFDKQFTNPKNTSESVRITSVFNGHWNETGNYLGLGSLQDTTFKELLWRYFTEAARVPDTLVFNSGLHDGVHWKSIRGFTDAAEYAVKFWGEVMEFAKGRGMGTPRLFYRTTIATGGYARDLAFNPNKMEVFNGVFVEKLKKAGMLSSGGVIDEFDMTFPWHYDNRCNDGVHYGRAPAKARWRDGEMGHQYFVDLMLVHVLLNAICDG